MSMFLYFVTEPDLPDANGNVVEGDPLLGSAGKDEADSWTMLASNRQRELGVATNAQELRTELEGRGCVVRKYIITPLNS